MDSSAREAFLAECCADDTTLKQELIELIRADETTVAPGGSELSHGSPGEEVFRPGERLKHYQIHGEIGSGGMGIVYKAHDTRLDRPVALKCLPPHLSKNSSSRQRFIIEAKSASRLDHVNVCVIYDIGETPSGDLFLTMPYYDGETLERRIDRGPLSLTEALSAAVQTCEGLAAAHGKGIVHRDIKPSNILLTTTGVIKILDFGIAKMGRLDMTQSGVRVGSLAYMAPERLLGRDLSIHFG